MSFSEDTMFDVELVGIINNELWMDAILSIVVYCETISFISKMKIFTLVMHEKMLLKLYHDNKSLLTRDYGDLVEHRK